MEISGAVWEIWFLHIHSALACLLELILFLFLLVLLALLALQISDEKYAEELQLQEGLALLALQISDEKYAEELQLQEGLFNSSSSSSSSSPILIIPKSEIKTEKNYAVASSSQPQTHLITPKQEEPQPQPQPEIFCTICMDYNPSDSTFTTSPCSHTFCNLCISQYISTQMKQSHNTITCPTPNCNSIITPNRDIVPEEVFERWEAIVIESSLLDSEKSYCPFNDCSELLLIDDDCGLDVAMAECPSCHRLFCAKCKVGWHAEMSCEEFEEVGKDGKVEVMATLKLVEREGWRRCPNCRFVVEKDSGCVHISCRCGYEFCYGCGIKWNGSHNCVVN